MSALLATPMQPCHLHHAQLGCICNPKHPRPVDSLRTSATAAALAAPPAAAAAAAAAAAGEARGQLRTHSGGGAGMCGQLGAPPEPQQRADVASGVISAGRPCPEGSCASVSGRSRQPRQPPEPQQRWCVPAGLLPVEVEEAHAAACAAGASSYTDPATGYMVGGRGVARGGGPSA